VGTLLEDLITLVLEAVERDSLQLKTIVKGSHFTGTLLENGSCGLCHSASMSNPINSCEQVRMVKPPDKPNITEILHFAMSKEVNLKKIIGISTLNAISQHILKEKKENYHFLFGTHPIDHIKLSKTDNVVMIGYIRPIVQKILQISKNFIAIDARLKNSDLPYLRSIETTREHLQKGDVVIITGSALANDSLETIIRSSENARAIAVVGPTAGFLPEPLFDRGATIISGMQILEPRKVLDVIVAGGGTPHFKQYCEKYNIIQK